MFRHIQSPASLPPVSTPDPGAAAAQAHQVLCAAQVPASSLLSLPELMSTALTVPSSMVRRGKKSSKKAGGAAGFVNKTFNPQATRPQPTLSSPLHAFTTVLESTGNAFTTSTSVPTMFSASISLSGLANQSKYVALFDEYRIEQAEIWLEPSIVMSPSVGSAQFGSVIDLDDANTPSQFGDVTGKQGAIVSETGTGHYHKWRPFVANALYSGAFTSFGSEPAPWIDCASPSVQHFGVKAMVPAADGIARLYYYTIRVVVSFRGNTI